MNKYNCCILVIAILFLIVIICIDQFEHTFSIVTSFIIGFIIGLIIRYISERFGFIVDGGGETDGTLTKEEANNLEYPYTKLFTSDGEIVFAFNKIKESKLDIVEAFYQSYDTFLEKCDKKFKGLSQIIRVDDDRSGYDFLSDVFNQHIRIKCKRYDQEHSPLEYWTENKTKVINKCLQNFGSITYKNLSETLRDMIGECATFRASLLSGFIKYFNAKSILDFSAGWGDRLIAAIANDVEYTGVDPNTELFPGYQKIIDSFAKDKSKYKLINSPFEDVELGDIHVDLVFTSPPYFNLEIYSTDQTQSVMTNPSLDSWYNNFLIVALRKSWKVLNPGGHMVINISDVPKRSQYVLRMRNDVDNFADSKYLGLLPYSRFINNSPIAPRHVWVWQKLTK